MFRSNRVIFFVCLLFCNNLSFAQITINNEITVEQAVNEYLLPAGIEAFNVTINGMPADSAVLEVGAFDASPESFGLDSGMVISTTSVSPLFFSDTTNSDQGFDADLELILSETPWGSNVVFYDLTVIEFDFIPIGDSISFNFVFTSQEYNNFVCSSFDDIFGMFLSGPYIEGPYSGNAQNIALIPGTLDPISVNSVNNGQVEDGEFVPCSWGTVLNCPCNSDFFIPNINPSDSLNSFDYLNPDISSGGYTVPISAYASVQCGNVYHLKIVIANTADASLDAISFIAKGNSNMVSVDDEVSPQCADPNAANFNPNATCNTDCVYQGCTDPQACNYDPIANEDDDSCNTIATYSGHVYFDENENEQFDSTNTSPEFTLAYWPIQIDPLGIIVYTDDNGYFEFEAPMDSLIVVSLLDANPSFTPIPLFVNMEVSAENCDTIINLGVNIDEENSSASAQFSVPDLVCNSIFAPSVFIQNTGNDTLSGIITMDINPLLIPTVDAVIGISPTSVEANSATWIIESLPPGQNSQYQIAILPSGEDLVGQLLALNVECTLFKQDGTAVYYMSDEVEPEVLCAYDPNDKLANPIGYTEQHFILTGSVIEYSIRFQNTGNLPAQSVLIVDTLDETKLDLSTFEVLHASHNMATTFSPSESVVQFHFDEINLPDSASNEPESHGFLTFSIQTMPDLNEGETVENSAAIFFDDNAPIITNSYLHTIFNCAGLAEFAVPESFCAGDEVTFTSFQDYIENYSWLVNGDELSADSTVSLNTQAGELHVQLFASNPICEEDEAIYIDVQTVPTGSVFMLNDVVIAPPGTYWQWYLDGQLIPGANSQSIFFQGDGTYSVEVFNGEYCSSFFEAIITDLDHHELSEISIYPNPADDVALLELGDRSWNVEIIDASGKRIAFYQDISGNLPIHKQYVNAGKYFLTVSNTKGEKKTLRLIIN